MVTSPYALVVDEQSYSKDYLPWLHSSWNACTCTGWFFIDLLPEDDFSGFVVAGLSYISHRRNWIWVVE